ncbi:RrF2 family transcriptional regulator [Planctomycetota bacterium]
MKLRTRARYSLRMMMAIAKLSSDEKPIGLGEVSRHCSLSRRYLDQLVPALKRAALVHVRAGRKGGYFLAKEAEQIKVGDIIEAAIGPVAIAECVTDPHYCIHTDFCNCRALWMLVNRRITEVLNDYTLADLLDSGWSRRVNAELALLA